MRAVLFLGLYIFVAEEIIALSISFGSKYAINERTLIHIRFIKTILWESKANLHLTMTGRGR